VGSRKSRFVFFILIFYSYSFEDVFGCFCLEFHDIAVLLYTITHQRGSESYNTSQNYAE